ncbi:unnamed protein product [Arabis nemorensis]|uniref:Uncharacterized protein n=1 Tax=Arabis nemorensis TaxID=586526 RepID=A0A565B5M8_9BRAS|nr:unnamed protein product [Arabis nemorensis]
MSLAQLPRLAHPQVGHFLHSEHGTQASPCCGTSSFKPLCHPRHWDPIHSIGSLMVPLGHSQLRRHGSN